MDSNFKAVCEFIQGGLETQQLLKAAARDDMQTMGSLDDQGVDVNLKNKMGRLRCTWRSKKS